MTTIAQYSLRGGTVGIARRRLEDEKLKAVSDPTHLLHESVIALMEGDADLADELEKRAAALAAEDPNAPEWLRIVATLQRVADIAERLHAQDRLLQLDNAGREAVRKDKSNAGRRKGAEARQKTLTAWNAYVERDGGKPPHLPPPTAS